MKKVLTLALLIAFSSITDVLLGQKSRRTKTVKGVVTDHTEQPVKNVQIYLDMVRTTEKTNDKGKYKIKIPGTVQLMTIYHPDYGFINWKLNSERKIDFLFPEDSEPMKAKDFAELGYDMSEPKDKRDKMYESYANILEILDKQFVQVRVFNGSIIVGRRGAHTITGDQTPLILVNDVPTNVQTLETIPTTEVASIKVVHKGSELASYGMRGTNGVIIIKLKDGTEKS